jgi:hypothetical protein
LEMKLPPATNTTPARKKTIKASAPIVLSVKGKRFCIG